MLISLGGAHFFDRPRAISTRCSNENRFFIASVVKKRSRPRGVSKIEPYAFPSSFSLFFALPKCAYFPRRRSYFRIFGTSLERECEFHGFWGRAGSSSIFVRISMDLELWKITGSSFLSDFLRIAAISVDFACISMRNRIYGIYIA